MSMPHHHGDYERQSELMKRFQAERDGTAQREFPQGRLSGDDDGSLTFKIGADPEKGIVAIEYSKPTAWVAMPPQQAIELAQALIKHARSIATSPLTINLH